MKPYLLLGFGNPDLTDDGIGTRLVWEIAKKLDASRFDSITEMVCSPDILTRIEGHQTLFVLDGMKTGRSKPGTISEFQLNNYTGFIHLDNYHDVSFRDTISMGRSLDMAITDDIHIIGMEVHEVNVFNENLSPPLQDLFPELLERILRYIDTTISLAKIQAESESF